MPEGPSERRVGADAKSMDAAEHSAMLERVMAMGGNIARDAGLAGRSRGRFQAAIERARSENLRVVHQSANRMCSAAHSMRAITCTEPTTRHGQTLA